MSKKFLLTFPILILLGSISVPLDAAQARKVKCGQYCMDEGLRGGKACLKPDMPVAEVMACIDPIKNNFINCRQSRCPNNDPRAEIDVP